MVTGMTFNEAVVCNHLLHQRQADPDHPLTATDLCEKTSLLKSQMNQVLSALEKQGYVVRSRSSSDRRQVELTLTDTGEAAYRQALDLYWQDPEHFRLPDWLEEETRKVSHRQYSTGFIPLSPPSLSGRITPTLM